MLSRQVKGRLTHRRRWFAKSLLQAAGQRLRLTAADQSGPRRLHQIGDGDLGGEDHGGAAGQCFGDHNAEILAGRGQDQPIGCTELLGLEGALQVSQPLASLINPPLANQAAQLILVAGGAAAGDREIPAGSGMACLEDRQRLPACAGLFWGADGRGTENAPGTLPALGAWAADRAH